MTGEKRKLEEKWLATRAAIRAKIQKSGPTMTQEEVEEWLAIRRDAGLQIDPETAEVEWIYALTVDPYGIYPELPEEYQQVGREYFAHCPGSDVWVRFGDLPEATEDALWQKYKSRLAFPAGLPWAGQDGRPRE
jgi:hypothetical protein